MLSASSCCCLVLLSGPNGICNQLPGCAFVPLMKECVPKGFDSKGLTELQALVKAYNAVDDKIWGSCEGACYVRQVRRDECTAAVLESAVVIPSTGHHRVLLWLACSQCACNKVGVCRCCGAVTTQLVATAAQNAKHKIASGAAVVCCMMSTYLRLMLLLCLATKVCKERALMPY